MTHQFIYVSLMYHGHPLYRVGELRDGTQPHMREIKEVLEVLFEVSLEHDLSNPAGKKGHSLWRDQNVRRLEVEKNTVRSVVYDRFGRMGEKVAWSEFSQLGLSTKLRALFEGTVQLSAICYLFWREEKATENWELSQDYLKGCRI